MLRLPKDAIDQKTLEAFCISPHLEFESLAEHWLLTWYRMNDDHYYVFDEKRMSYLMTQLAPIREELLWGDLRSLYIGWLCGVTCGVFKAAELEPLALAGLHQLTPAQLALASYLKVDVDLLAGVINDSQSTQTEEKAEDDSTLDAWLEKLPRAEQTAYLRQILKGQGIHVERSIKRHFDASQTHATPLQSPRRSVAQLWRLADKTEHQRSIANKNARREAKDMRKKQRDAALAELAADFQKAWDHAHQNAQKARASAYDAACQQLVDLRNAYNQQSSPEAFQSEIEKFVAQHKRRRALMQRLVKAGLWSLD